MRQYLPLSPTSEKEAGHPDPHARTLYLGGRAIPPGAYVMYPFSDVHLSSEMYKDPWRWDPGRTEMGLKAPYSYVGMGAGTCDFSLLIRRCSVPSHNARLAVLLLSRVC